MNDMSVLAPRSAEPAEPVLPVTATAPSPLPWWHTGPGRTALIILVVFALAFTLQQTRAVILPIVLSLLIAIILSAPMRWLRRLRLPTALAAGMVVICFSGGVGYTLYLLADPATSWLERAPRTFRDIERKVRNLKASMASAQQAAQKVQEMTRVGPQNQPREVTVKEPSLAERALTSTPVAAFYLVEVIVLVYFILAFGEVFVRKLVKIPQGLRGKIHVVKILQEIERDISQYLFTVACINAGLGVATGIAMWLLRMPNPVLWGVMAAVFNFVPYLGSTVTLSVLTLVALITFDSLGHALLVPAVFLTIATIEGQIVSPIIVGRRMALSPLVIVIALMVGAWIWGVIGVLMAVPLLVMFKIFFSHTEELAPYADLLGKE